MSEAKVEGFEDLFDDKNVPESNWFKFDKVGDKVAGELVEISEKEGDGDFAAQRIFSLKQKDGSIMNVGIAETKTYIIQRTNNIDLENYDYLVGFEFKKEIPASVKGYSPAKSIELYIKKTPKSSEEITADDIPA